MLPFISLLSQQQNISLVVEHDQSKNMSKEKYCFLHFSLAIYKHMHELVLVSSLFAYQSKSRNEVTKFSKSSSSVQNLVKNGNF